MIGKDGTVYVNSTHWSKGADEFDHYLYALDPRNGEVKWSHNIGSTRSGPCIGKDDTIYTAGSHGIYALYPDGKIKWNYPRGLWHLGPIADDGTVYAVSFEQGELHAINSDGTLRWMYQAPDEIEEYPAVILTPSLGTKGTLYIITNGSRQINKEVNHLFALHPEKGETLWKYDFQDEPNSNIAIGAEGTLYFVDGNRFIAMDENGQELWSYEDETMDKGKIAIGSEGSVYYFSRYLFAFSNQDGSSIETMEESLENEIKPEITEESIKAEPIKNETKLENMSSDKDKASFWAMLIFLTPALGIIIILGILWMKRKKQLNVK